MNVLEKDYHHNTLRKVPFMDLRVQSQSERKHLLDVIEIVLAHGRIINGPEVAELEKKISTICDRRFGIGVNSGTDALFLGLKALGIKKGDEVIIPSLTWIATGNAVALTGATPVFADITSDLQIDLESIGRLTNDKTKAIIPVHFTGKMCSMLDLMSFAREKHLLVIEDAAQAFLSTCNGKRAGSFGDMACFSMNPTKVLAACGEAGMILTDSPLIYDRLQALKNNGLVNRTRCIDVSLNGRLDTIQAAILLHRLQQVEKIIEKRRLIASWYNEKLGHLVEIPKERANCKDVFYTYTIRLERRDELKKVLEEKGIEVQIHYEFFIPEQPPYREAARGEWKNAKELVTANLCLPCNETLSREDVDYVTDWIIKFFRS